MLGLAVLRLPHEMSFGAFIFGDHGGWLTVQALAARGVRPGVDFSYFYGLLPIFVGRLWFGAFGLTPIAFEVASMLCGLMVALAIARFASALRLNAFGMAILVVAAPIAIPSAYYSLAHGIAAALLSNALAGFAQRRRAQALALATAACFAKPEMGYFFGLFILIAIVAAASRRDADGRRGCDWRAVLRDCAPAAVTGALLAPLMAFMYGVPSLLATLLPTGGISNYQALGFGLFNHGGREFYYFPGAPLIAYFALVVPFWFLGGIWLTVAGVFAAARLIGRDPADAGDPRLDAMVAFCAGAHLLAALVMFGGPASWMNYSFVLVMGVAASAAIGDFSFAPVAILVLIAVLSDFGTTVAAVGDWRGTAPAAATAGLWASPAQRADWRTIERLTRGHRTIVISITGAAPILFPGFMPASASFLLPGKRIGDEFAHTRDGIEHAQFVVTPVIGNPGDARHRLPWLRRELASFPVVWRSADLEVRRNPRPLRSAG